ncbi:MAG: peptidoglycan DD-metalloendopeptidase family protein [Candidatus Hydrogenedens sp.]|nr:peptidoglycan DD-metalloendopeptidase family protein [Candidatus Hydrogenedens sp.]
MKKIIFFIIINLILNSALSQKNIDILNNQKKEVEAKIYEISNQITSLEKNRNVTLTEITLKKQKIKLQNELLENLRAQILTLNTNLLETTKIIDSISYVLQKRREELVIIYNTYFKKLREKNHILLLLLSSNSFNQAYARLKMYKNLSSYFNKLLLEIEDERNRYENYKEMYVLNIKQLKLKENEYQRTIRELDITTKNLENSIENLEKKKNALLEEQKRNEKRLVLIDNEIKRLIEENAKSLKKMSPERTRVYSELSKNFRENKGKLPLPAANATLLNQFGETKHPVLKNISIKNNGIDLIMKSSEPVYSVFSGEVTKVFNVPYGGLAIIIRHGEYLTVYSNLLRTGVKPGQKVTIGEKIGELIQQPDNTYILHFEIWNEKEPENPLIWLKY